MRVICTNPGKQTEEGASVIFGNEYNVIDWCYGGECGNYVKGMERFYQLAEMPEYKRFWSGLFSELSESENVIEKNQTISV